MTKTLLVLWYLGAYNGSASGTSSVAVMTWDQCQTVAHAARRDNWKVYCYKMEPDND